MEIFKIYQIGIFLKIEILLLIMIWKVGTRIARSTLGNNFADVWYTFVRSFNRLDFSSLSLADTFSDSPDRLLKATAQIPEQREGYIQSLVEQAEILKRLVSEQSVPLFNAKIREVLTALYKDLKDAQTELGKLPSAKDKSKFSSQKEEVEQKIIHARKNIYLLASLKKEKK